MIALGRTSGIAAEHVAKIDLRVNELAVRITGVTEPQTGLQSKFSIYHSAAVAFIDGDAGIAQYTNEKALDPHVVGLRRKVDVIADASLRKDEARATIVATDGRRFDVHIPHATGTIDNPMPDMAIQSKFMANATPLIGAARAHDFVQNCWHADNIKDARDLVALIA
jgi:2-methylcitrate dehydratase PrpD